MPWNVVLTKSAERELDSLPDNVAEAAVENIAEIGEDPHLHGSIELDGYPGHRRIHFYRDRFRIVYYVAAKQRRIVITRIRPRGTAYIGYESPRG